MRVLIERVGRDMVKLQRIEEFGKGFHAFFCQIGPVDEDLHRNTVGVFVSKSHFLGQLEPYLLESLNALVDRRGEVLYPARLFSNGMPINGNDDDRFDYDMTWGYHRERLGFDSEHLFFCRSMVTGGSFDDALTKEWSAIERDAKILSELTFDSLVDQVLTTSTLCRRSDDISRSFDFTNWMFWLYWRCRVLEGNVTTLQERVVRLKGRV